MIQSRSKLVPLELKANLFFEDFSEKEIAELLNVGKLYTCSPGEYIVREQEVSRDLYVVLAGKMAIGKILYAGDEKQLGTIGPGEFFGEMAFLDGGPRSASVSCIEDARLLKIDWESFQKLAAKQPNIPYRVAMKIAGTLANRLRISNDVVEGFFSNPNKAILEFKTRLLKIQTMLQRI